jgi:hypothetical protein
MIWVMVKENVGITNLDWILQFLDAEANNIKLQPFGVLAGQLDHLRNLNQLNKGFFQSSEPVQ